MLDIILDTLLDALKTLPFLFLTYWILEYLEHRSGEKLQQILGSGRFGAIGGALLGSFPQCGFSVAAANLYAGGLITTGTLVAVFLATSDEAIPLLIANPGNWSAIGKLLLTKIIIAILAGCFLDFTGLFFAKQKRRIPPHHQPDVTCHCKSNILLMAIRHTLQIFFFLLIIMFVLNLLIAWVGQEPLAAFLSRHSLFQPFLAALIGFIPNCASSVLLTQLYIAGSISFGAVIAGLCTGAGVGLIVLFKQNHRLKENLCICLFLYVVAVAAGMLLSLWG